MKYLPTVAGAVLGLLFVVFSAMVLFRLAPIPPPPPADTPVGMFMGAFFGTGYIILVKICEMVGGILVAFPKTRNFGLLVLGPVIINILAFHIFIAKDSLLNPILILITVLPLYLLWVERKKFLSLLN